VIVYPPPELAVNVTSHAALSPVAVAGSVHEPELPNAPVVGAELNWTTPVGAPWGAASVSVTVAVHVVAAPVPAGDGEQVTAAEVASSAAEAGADHASMPTAMATTSNPMRRARVKATYSGIRSWWSSLSSRER
jgi:hypothetical protein